MVAVLYSILDTHRVPSALCCADADDAVRVPAKQVSPRETVGLKSKKSIFKWRSMTSEGERGGLLFDLSIIIFRLLLFVYPKITKHTQ